VAALEQLVSSGSTDAPKIAQLVSEIKILVAALKKLGFTLGDGSTLKKAEELVKRHEGTSGPFQ